MSTEETYPLLQPDPSSEPGPANDWTRSDQTGIPQPDGSVLLVGPPTGAQPGPPNDSVTGAAVSQDEPLKKLPLDSAPGASPGGMPQRHDPRTQPARLDPAPGDITSLFPNEKMSPPLTRLDPAPGDMQQTLDPAPGDIRYLQAATGATPGFRPAGGPPSGPLHGPLHQEGAKPPKLPQADANQAPDNRQHPLELMQYPPAIRPSSMQPAYPSQRYPQPQYMYPQRHPQQYPYPQPQYSQHPYPQPPYPQPQYSQHPYPQPPYPQPHPPGQHGHHGYPGGYGTTPPQVPQQPIKTSRKFDTKTLGDNQYYLSICLLITICICLNPLALICAITAFKYAHKAADANEANNIEVARKHQKKALFCNVGGYVALVLGASTFAVLLIIEGFSCTNHCIV